MITKQLKKVIFTWDGKYMGIKYPEHVGDPYSEELGILISRVHLLSLVRFALRCLTRKHK